MKKELNLKQNLCAAKVFLNTFGLNLEKKNSINLNSKLKIFNANKDQVGYLYFKDDNIIMNAKYNRGNLQASYNKVDFIEYKKDESGKIIYDTWTHKIDFNIYNYYISRIWGELFLTASIDNELNKDCLAQLSLNYSSRFDKDITIKMHNKGKFFDLVVKMKPIIEHININSNGSIRHNRIIGGYVKNMGFYGLRRATVSNSKSNPKDKIQLNFLEKSLDDIIQEHSEIVTKIGADFSKELLIQKGKLMNHIDLYYYSEIQFISEELTIDGESLLENLIGICYNDMDEEVINSLFGIDKKVMVYQNGANNLIEGYFGKTRKNKQLVKHKK